MNIILLSAQPEGLLLADLRSSADYVIAILVSLPGFPLPTRRRHSITVKKS